MAEAPLQEQEPFRVVLKRLRQERGLSIESLAYLTRDRDPDDKGISFGGVGHLERGQHQPKPETIELLAAALEVPPETFVEYRLARLRALFDEREVGLNEAEANARELSAALSDGGLPEPPGELRRRLKAASPSSPDPARTGSDRTRRKASRRKRA